MMKVARSSTLSNRKNCNSARSIPLAESFTFSSANTLTESAISPTDSPDEAKIDLHCLAADLPLQLGDPAVLGALLARTTEGPFSVSLEFASPAMQIARMHLQRTGHLAHALSGVQAPHRCLFEFLRELPA